LTGQRVVRLFDLIRRAWEARRIHVPTGLLNNLFAPDMTEKWSTGNPGKKLDIRYMTQASSVPPTFVVFTSSREPLHFSTERFMVNQIRERFGFYATPIRIRQRMRRPAKGRSR